MTGMLGMFYALIILCVLVGILLIAKMLIDRSRYAKRAMNHVWIEILPHAGKDYDLMLPIEGNKVHIPLPNKSGIPGKKTKTFATHIMGEAGERLANWPPGKMRFAQTTVTKLIYREGDSEPLSKMDDRPIVSAQLLENTIEGVATASAEAMRKSMEASEGGGIRKAGGLLWVYIGIFLVGVISIVSIVLTSGASGKMSSVQQDIANINKFFQVPSQSAEGAIHER